MTDEEVVEAVRCLTKKIRQVEDGKNRAKDRDVYRKSRGRCSSNGRDSHRSDVGRETKDKVWNTMDKVLNPETAGKWPGKM